MKRSRRQNFKLERSAVGVLGLADGFSDIDKMHRAERMADTLREEITEIVGYEMKDPRLQAVTVTDVRVAEDLRNASVFVVVSGTEKEIEDALVALNRAATFVRQQVALSLNMRYAPILHFARDTVEENAASIEAKLKDIGLEK